MESAVFALPTYFPDRDGPEGPYMRRLVDFLASAEDLGYDSVWANEHHYHPYGGMIPSPTLMLAALAQRTHRVRLGTSVVVLPLHNPLEIAEQLSMVDLMSGGRLELGVGRGFVVYDYEVLDIPVEEGQERTVEGLDLILKAWSRQRFSHQGKYHQYENIEVWPRPEQLPHPPVWMAATSNPDSFRLVGQRGHDLLSVAYLRPMEDLARLIDIYRESLAASGRDPFSTRVGTHYQVVIADSGSEARATAKEALKQYMLINKDAQSLAKRQIVRPESAALGQDPNAIDIDRLVGEGRVLAGTPEEIVAILERARDVLRLTSVDCTFTFGGIPFDQAEESMRRFAAEVMPRLRARDLAAAPVR